MKVKELLNALKMYKPESEVEIHIMIGDGIISPIDLIEQDLTIIDSPVYLVSIDEKKKKDRRNLEYTRAANESLHIAKSNEDVIKEHNLRIYKAHGRLQAMAVAYAAVIDPRGSNGIYEIIDEELKQAAVKFADSIRSK